LACVDCGTELPIGAAFCFACGRAVVTAPAAGGARAPEAYTPNHLAEKILASRSALEGERKQVTVLFIDVSGFTSLSERVDPEDVHRLMTEAFELMLAEVHRYEGTVNQFLGDGIMALFGAPIAHEDHARRAVLAALGIQRALAGYREDPLRRRGIDFQVRQGLNTGLVVVGSIGNDLRMDYTAVGDTTNVAARLQQVAQPGSIVIAEPTYRLTAGFFHMRSLGELRLKGKAEPAPAWEVMTAREARSRFDVEAERGLTILVARERELAALWDCFEKARAGQGQVVFIVGEPGIGKSRLVYELRRLIGNQAGWMEGRCVAFGRFTPFHPLIDLLRRKFGIEDGDDEQTAIDKIEGRVVALGDDLRSILPYVRYLLGIDPGNTAVSSMDPQERRGELFHALRRLVLREAERLPQVMVFEDIHWTDKATEDYLALVADNVPASPVLLVLTYRTSHSHPFGERSYHNRVAPGALSAGDTVVMAGAMLAAERLPDGLQALIARKAEGNPFFIEELVKSLREAGSIRPGGDGWVLTQRLDDLAVPDTIQDIIAARIDRLPEASKRALQAASVIGRTFSRRLLDRVVEPHASTETPLRELVGLELIRETRVFPESEYTFKHALTQDVAYGSLLGPRREVAPSPDRDGDRGPVEGPAGRAVRGPGAALREGGDLGQGARVPHAGGRQGSAGLCHARCHRAVRRGRGNCRPGAGGRSPRDTDDHPPPARRALRPRERLRSRARRVRERVATGPPEREPSRRRRSSGGDGAGVAPGPSLRSMPRRFPSGGRDRGGHRRSLDPGRRPTERGVRLRGHRPPRGCPDEVQPCPRPKPSDRGCRQSGDRAGLRRGTRKLGRSLCAGGRAVRRGDPSRPCPQHPRDARGHVHGGGQPYRTGRV
ncbi:MAG: hypothetical protein EHM13_01680, partial [Acidobacteria bacterium]